MTINRTISSRNPKAIWAVKIGAVMLHCNMLKRTKQGRKGASLFYAIDSEVKFWVPNWTLFNCKDTVPLDGHFRVIINTDWLESKEYNLRMIRKDDTSFIRNFDPLNRNIN